MMEETVENVRQEVDQICHRDITPNYSVYKEKTRVAVTTEVNKENPECLEMHKSVAVQTVETEKYVFPKFNHALNQNFNLPIPYSGSGSEIRVDASSQESVTGIASQGSLFANGGNSETKHYSHQRVASVSMREIDVSIREENVKNREEAVLAKEEYIKNREEVVLAKEEYIKNREEADLAREQYVKKRWEDVLAREEYVKNREGAVLAREEYVKKREEAVLEYEQKLVK